METTTLDSVSPTLDSVSPGSNPDVSPTPEAEATTESKRKRCPEPKMFFAHRVRELHGYTVSYMPMKDCQQLHFACMKNFHYVNGDMEVNCLDNGTWSAGPPHCEVDYFMEKYRLSAFIITACFLVSILLLGEDFRRHRNHRRRIRSHRAESLMIKAMSERRFSQEHSMITRTPTSFPITPAISAAIFDVTHRPSVSDFTQRRTQKPSAVSSVMSSKKQSQKRNATHGEADLSYFLQFGKFRHHRDT